MCIDVMLLEFEKIAAERTGATRVRCSGRITKIGAPCRDRLKNPVQAVQLAGQETFALAPPFSILGIGASNPPHYEAPGPHEDTTMATSSPAKSAGWLTKSCILQTRQIGWRRLEQWRDDGLVRSVKLGPERNARRLYSAADLDRVLADLAAGHKPRRATRGNGG